MNQVILVGRLTDEIKTVETEDGRTISYVTLAVSRAYKNVDGIYETDFIRCVLWNGIATNAAEYCKKGDIVGVKGRLQTTTYDNDRDERHSVTDVVVEKLTFLSSKSTNNNERDDD